MQQGQLGLLWPISKLSISAAGLSSLWGKTTEAEGIATLQKAMDAGIDHIDVAPAYGRGKAEQLVGKAMSDGWPRGVRLSTKVRIGHMPAKEVLPRIQQSLTRSLQTMKCKRLDIVLLHSQIIPNSWTCARRQELQNALTIKLSLFRRAVVPAMQKMVRDGLCRAWGITGIGPNAALAQVFREPDPARRPDVAQCVVNALESAGALDFADPTQDVREIRSVASEMGVGVLGIRAVQAGALTDAMDRKPRGGDERDFEDYNRADWLRDYAKQQGMSIVELAYRYAIFDSRVDSVILGVKNRRELADGMAALKAGPLPDYQLQSMAAWLKKLPKPSWAPTRRKQR